MKSPELSEHYKNRKPSVIRSAQIKCNKREDIDSITVINLAIGNINLPMHPSMVSRLQGLGRDSFQDGVVKYTSSGGNQETKDAFLNILASDGVNTKDIHVNITDGASAAIELIMLGVCNSGYDEKIMLFDPTYTNYLDFARRLNIGVLTHARRIKDDGSFANLDISKLKKLFKSENIKGLIIIPYDNPTGDFIEQPLLEQIAKLCVEYGIWLISDEAYRPLYYEEKIGFSSIWLLDESTVPGITGLRIGIESSSKIWNACGLRIGAILTDNIAFHEKAISEYTANLCANSLGQKIFGALANESHQSIQNWYEKQKFHYKDIIIKLSEEFKKQIPGVIVSRPKAAIYFIIDLKNVVGVTFDAIDFTNYCAEEGRVKIGQNDYTLLLAPMSGFYSNKKLGRKQLRVAIVEDYKLIIKAPKILSKLLNCYSLRRNF